MIEYYHADRLDYAVAGTPDRLEYDQGFFVKNGEGVADVKPIAHLYKTQVYLLNFSLPYDKMDLCLYRPQPEAASRVRLRGGWPPG